MEPLAGKAPLIMLPQLRFGLPDGLVIYQSLPTSTFLGSHPRSAQVPPHGCESTMATAQPASRHLRATVQAPAPVPSTIKSNRFVMTPPRLFGGEATEPMLRLDGRCDLRRKEWLGLRSRAWPALHPPSRSRCDNPGSCVSTEVGERSSQAPPSPPKATSSTRGPAKRSAATRRRKAGRSAASTASEIASWSLGIAKGRLAGTMVGPLHSGIQGVAIAPGLTPARSACRVQRLR